MTNILGIIQNKIQGPTLEQQLQRIMKRSQDRDRETFMHPLGLPTTKSGFYKAYSASGEDIGYGFWCPWCRLNYNAGLTEHSEVRHCGKVSTPPQKGLLGFFQKLGLDSYRFTHGGNY